MTTKSNLRITILFVAAVVLLLLLASQGPAAVAATGLTYTYTLDGDFDDGTLVNVNYNSPNSDQLQLDSEATPFDFIWVAASGRGTIIKIDTNTGTILGEYLSAPAGRGRNPSRTTVDSNGNVWAGNRNESTGDKGSVVHIGLLENGQCDDRSGNGIIETSSGLGDIKTWNNPGGVDDGGGVSTADDECIIHYVRTAGTNVRTVAVDGSNDVWVGGLTNRVHEKIDGSTGIPVAGTVFAPACGGYGGLVDGNGVLWSSGAGYYNLLRYDPIVGGLGICIPLGRWSYGLGIDTNGNIWNSNFTFDSVMKIKPDGTISNTYGTGGSTNDRGVVVTPADNDVWIANSGGNNVSRLPNTGSPPTVITVGYTPTGVAVDSNGKVWVTNYNSNNVMRIDPSTNLVDLTVSLGAGALPYNYSDMTGSTLIAPPNHGTWTVVHDSELPNAVWRFVGWNALTPSDSIISVTVASSPDNITFTAPVAVTNGAAPSVADGQYLRVVVSFQRATAGGDPPPTPILYDLTVTANRPPNCTKAVPSVTSIWPPNHLWIPVQVLGVTDLDGDTVTITIDSIYQDEPVDTYGDGKFTPDGMGVGTSTALLRAERSGTKKVPGDGRVYHISFTADDGHGGTCTSGDPALRVSVPHDKKSLVADGGPLFDSTLP